LAGTLTVSDWCCGDDARGQGPDQKSVLEVRRRLESPLVLIIQLRVICLVLLLMVVLSYSARHAR
jgi:hypothetical protein